MRKRGSDLRYDLEISLKQAGEGLITTLTVGHGKRESELQIRVPSGVDTGSRLRFGGKGEAGWSRTRRRARNGSFRRITSQTDCHFREPASTPLSLTPGTVFAERI
jgi:DnaJ-class molecular chaperone